MSNSKIVELIPVDLETVNGGQDTGTSTAPQAPLQPADTEDKDKKPRRALIGGLPGGR
jgi:hypothetical protein